MRQSRLYSLGLGEAAGGRTLSLGLKELCKSPSELDQLIVGASFNNDSVVHDIDPVHCAKSPGSVGHDDCDSVAFIRNELIEYLLFRFGIDC